MSFVWALLLRWVFVLVLFIGICLPARVAVIRFVPEGKIKRLLLLPLDGLRADEFARPRKSLLLKRRGYPP